MHIKKVFFALALFAGIPMVAMEPGTVIDPLNYSGQFTVSLPNQASSLSSGTGPLTTSIKATAQELFKNKGVPVIISTAAGMMPWWALTTGTGYLIISQCNLSDPLLLTALAAGSSYAVGEQTNSVFKKYIANPYFKNATQVALCAACLSFSYLGTNPIVNQAFFTIAQTIGWQTILDVSTKIVANTTFHITGTSSDQSWFSLSPATTAGMIEGATNALSTMLPELCIANCYTAQNTLRILLYEQAYRLAQSGCSAAEQFFTDKIS